MLCQSYFNMFVPEVRYDWVADINKDLSDFNKYINQANELMEEMRLQNQHNAQILSDCYKTINDHQAMEEMQKILAKSSTPIVQIPSAIVDVKPDVTKATVELPWFKKLLERGHVEAAELNANGASIKNSLSSIATFCEKVMWVTEHPRETIKIILSGVCDFFEVLALIVCAASLIGAIFGHKDGIKWVPIAISVFTILKILVVVL